MKKNRKIGFNIDDDESEDQNEKEVKIHPFVTYISNNYKANGFAEEMQIMTTLELVHAVSEMFSVTEIRVIETLTDLKFDMKILDGEPCWLLYRIE